MTDSSRPASASTPPVPVVRKMGLSFDEVPIHWFYGSALTTHIANGLNLLFPAGERFFIRSVKHYLPGIEDPDLRARCRAFFGQEGSHGHEHERAFEMLERQGFDVRTFLDWYETTAYAGIEPRVPPSLRLATTVALEHFTATLAEDALCTEFLEHAHPKMQLLLRWHAAEEIEHKSVAFDVFQAVDGRYVVRIAGLVVGAAVLLYFWRKATAHLLATDPQVTRDRLKRERAEARARGQTNRFLRKAIVDYLRPSFHPEQNDNRPLARSFLSSIGRLAA